jgi:hypothetical protein
MSPKQRPAHRGVRGGEAADAPLGGLVVGERFGHQLGQRPLRRLLVVRASRGVELLGDLVGSERALDDALDAARQREVRTLSGRSNDGT